MSQDWRSPSAPLMRLLSLLSLVTAIVSSNILDGGTATLLRLDNPLAFTPELENSEDEHQERHRELQAKPWLPVIGTSWSPVPNYPVYAGEAEGGFMGTKLVGFGGFTSKWFVHNRTFALDISAAKPSWTEMANFPVSDGFTHVATHAINNKLYAVGGYVGKHPGPDRSDAFVFDIAAGPKGTWSKIPSLPEGRGAGGLVHIESKNALMYAFGATRPDGLISTQDRSNAWILKLDDFNAGWKPVASTPYAGNHLGYVTTKDCQGNQHFYFFGGQIGEQDKYGMLDQLFEYIPEPGPALGPGSWIARAKSPYPRGHVAASVRPYGCGFITVAGAINSLTNGFAKTSDVTYYDISTDTWTKIGSFVTESNTPLCDIGRVTGQPDYLYCGVAYSVNVYKTTIKMASAPATSKPTKAPTSAPTFKPTKAPTFKPVKGTARPTKNPTLAPTTKPTAHPTLAPLAPSRLPSHLPSEMPVEGISNVLPYIFLNSGSSENYIDSEGNFWVSDGSYYQGGLSGSTDQPLQNTVDTNLYKVYRTWDDHLGFNLMYQINLPNGQYVVDLFFYEKIHTTVGQRVFNIHIEGNLAVEAFDIINEAGAPLHVVKKTVTTSVGDSLLTIMFVPIIDRPVVSGVAISRVMTVG